MKKILLAEDDPFLIDIYTNKLKSAGFEVEVAEVGDDVLRKLKEKKFALLLLDIVLPGTSGWEILEEIKEQKSPKDPDKSGPTGQAKIKNLEDLKIVIISNLGQKSEVEKGLKLGVTEYLIKAHYTPSQVVEEIKKIL